MKYPSLTHSCLIDERTSSSRFSCKSHTVRVSAEKVNVPLNPLQRKSLIEESSIGNASLGCEFRTAKESESTKAVVESNVDKIVVALSQKASRRTAV